MSTLKDHVTQQGSKRSQSLSSDPFLSKIHELPVNGLNWIGIEINGNSSWLNRLCSKFCLYFFMMVFPRLDFPCCMPTSKVDGGRRFTELRNDSPRHPSQNGEALPIAGSLYRWLITVCGFFKEPSTMGSSCTALGVKSRCSTDTQPMCKSLSPVCVLRHPG